jgi:FtsH-binding integral membrane protein
MENTNALSDKPMKWYHYIAAFFAGVFLTNVVPHFVNGISGNPFPTPFANPPGKGLSSPLINVLWALFNLLIGYLLFRVSKMSSKNKLAMLIFFIGIVFISVQLSIVFLEKAKQ